MPAAAVTTHAKPHAQQQIARDLEVDYENFLTNVRGPPDKYGLLTLGRPCVRCYSTLRALSPSLKPQVMNGTSEYSSTAPAVD